MTKKRKPGRPPVITPRVEERLLKGVTDGATVREVCRRLGIHYNTVAKKEYEDREFMGRLARARLAGAALCVDEAEDKLRKATPRNIAMVRELAHHLRWKASKLLPQYSDRVSVGLGAPGQPGEPRSAIETARMMLFVLHDARREQEALHPRGPAALPAPAPEPEERKVEPEPEPPPERPPIEGASERVSGLATKPVQTQVISGRRRP